METALSVFTYNNLPISFRKANGSLMVNATEMAKQFNKTAKDWLRIQPSQDFIASLSAVRQICPTGLVKILQGGNQEQGTWMHEDVALEFARWLSPEFSIWCNDRIKELIVQGQTQLDNQQQFEVPKTFAEALMLAAKQQEEIEGLHQANNILQGENEHLTAENAVLMPKAVYTDEVLQSPTTYTLTQVAHDLGMRSVHTLTAGLKRLNIAYKQSGQWIPFAKYADKGYFTTRTARFFRSNGSIGTSMSTVITEAGRQWLHNQFDKPSLAMVNY
jgi:phage antirepressor YoqD-like protein